MTQETQISLSVIFSLVALAGTVFGIVNIVKQNNDKKSKEKETLATAFATINTKLDFMVQTMTELKDRQDRGADETQALREELIEVVGKLDSLKDRVATLEERDKV